MSDYVWRLGKYLMTIDENELYEFGQEDLLDGYVYSKGFLESRTIDVCIEDIETEKTLYEVAVPFADIGEAVECSPGDSGQYYPDYDVKARLWFFNKLQAEGLDITIKPELNVKFDNFGLLTKSKMLTRYYLQSPLMDSGIVVEANKPKLYKITELRQMDWLLDNGFVYR